MVRFIFCSSDGLEKVLTAIEGVPGFEPKVIHISASSCESSRPFRGVETLENFIHVDNEVSAAPYSGDLAEDALIFWTSGTTGARGINGSARSFFNPYLGSPKGVRISFGAIIANLGSKSSPVLDSTCTLMTCSMFHRGGFFQALIRLMAKEAQLVTYSSPRDVSAEKVFEAVHEFKPGMLHIGTHHAIDVQILVIFFAIYH